MSSNFKHVNAIAGRLSLRPPQRKSLEILDRITEIMPPHKEADIASALEIIKSEYPTVTDFERDFPSLCFALATGVGKTRLMGAFIAYLHLAHGINNFFVLAPNLTIYNKLIADFTPNTRKYVFKGIAEFSLSTPEIITGETYENRGVTRQGILLTNVRINIFNISKINSEVRGGKAPRIKRLSEYLGDSYFNYLSELKDLVLIMDESHRYRASAGIKAINELKPILGLELTATPFVETSKAPLWFKNVIYDYPLGKAMEDGYVKEPAVVTRKDFNPAGMSPEAIERLKLEDGIRLHESVKVELETYARENNTHIVKPFLLVIARDTTHAGQLLNHIQSNDFFESRYKEKVIQVDSSVKEDETIERLLKVENNDEPTEIVIHVNMLKEGWDVTNLYTIVPLRAANARTLIEQSIGRGLRLPYGKKTGVASVDRLNIVAHDKFQEIVDEANKPDSTIRMQKVIISGEQLGQKTSTVVSQSNIETALGIKPQNLTSNTKIASSENKPIFESEEEQKIAQITYDVIKKYENKPDKVPSSSYFQQKEVQEMVLQEVQSQYKPKQGELEGIIKTPNIASIVAKTSEFIVQKTIDIPRIIVVPKGEVKSGFKSFTLSLSGINYPAPSDELWAKHLRTGQMDIIGLGQGNINEERLEDYIVSGLIDFDDIAYDLHADLLYELAIQVKEHLLSYLKEEEARKVLAFHQKQICHLIHAQMQEHYWVEKSDDEVIISKGFTELKPSAYTFSENEQIRDFRIPPEDKSNMAKYLFGGFKKCLYSVQKFQSDAERKLSIILERDAIKWFKPAKGQFQMFYKSRTEHREYLPDFVAETSDTIYMLEPKASNQMTDAEVLAKKEVAVKWCKNASDYAQSYGGKAWRYVLIPHDAIADNMSIEGLAKLYGDK